MRGLPDSPDPFRTAAVVSAGSRVVHCPHSNWKEHRVEAPRRRPRNRVALRFAECHGNDSQPKLPDSNGLSGGAAFFSSFNLYGSPLTVDFSPFRHYSAAPYRF